MKKMSMILLGLWCSFASFISPIWLTIIFLNITGLIYQYDSTMDEGTAIIIGIVLLVLWILFGLIPNIYMAGKAGSVKRSYLIGYVGCMTALCGICMALCNWNVVSWLTA